MGESLNQVESLECDLPPKFVEKLKKLRIVEMEGAVIVEGESWCAGDFEKDPTGLECSANHYHLDGPGDGSPRAGVIAGIVAAREFKRKIEATKIPGKFRIIVSASYSATEPPVFVATVRFHKIRPSKPWLADDLEDYKLEALLTLDWTNPGE